MRNRIIAVWLFALCIGNGLAQSPGFLRTKDARIVDGQGREIILRGMGLGGWMLQEGYMLGIRGEGTQHSIKAKIADLIGQADCEKFYELWLQNHMTRADVDLLAKSGFNSIRLPMHYNLFTLPIEQEPVTGSNTWLSTGFALTDQLLDWCRANRMYLILDLHAAPGGQGKDANISDYDPAEPSLWESEANKQKTIALWRKLAERYANDAWLGGYDLLNEPNWTFEGKDKNGKEDSSNKPIWDLYQAITTAIREVDRNHLIVIEGNGWGNNYNGFPGPWDDNLVMSFHKYWNPNTQEAIAPFLALREKYGVPIWLGESGENNNQWFRECVALVEKNDIGWAWWPHKKVNSSSCVLTIEPPDEFGKVVDYWNQRGERPAPETARKGLFELAENAKAGNCRFNTNVVQALIPPDSSSPRSANRAYQFDKTISRAVLENYLSRSVTMEGLLNGRGDLDDNIRMLTSMGAKFIGRSLCLWGGEANLLANLQRAKEQLPKVHAADPDMILQACIFEIVTTQVEQVPVPDWAFAAFGLPAETRNFRYADMLYPSGRLKDHWRPDHSVPDVSRPETKLWFYFLGASFIDVGCEAIHLGQTALMNGNDRNLDHYSKVLSLIRSYAARHARRHMVLCDSHVPSGGLVRDGQLLMDFHSFPLRIMEVPDKQQEAILEVGFSDGIYGRSKGGTTFSGWNCDHLPFLVEIDNWGVSKHPGQARAGGIWIWGYDEITWFAHQNPQYRSNWLHYAWNWVRQKDPNGYLQMPGSRTLRSPLDNKRWYYANQPSPAVPDGFGDEEAIRAIWAVDDKERH